MKNAIRIMLALAWVVVLAQPTITTAAEKVTIAVVRDGPSGTEVGFVHEVERELKRLIDDDIEVYFDSGPQYDANWESGRALAILRNALVAPDVDIILGAGPLVTKTAAAPDVPLTRPFISTFVHRPDAKGLPVADGRSQKEGFNVMVLGHGASQDIEAFHSILRFKTLHVGFANESSFAEEIEAWGRSAGSNMVAVNFLGDIQRTIDTLGNDVEAFLLLQMTRLTDDQRKELIEGLTAKKIPTFSLRGHRDVELGALAANTPDYQTQRARRVALNLSRIIRGESVSELPVTLNVETRLLINGRTAAAVGYTPSMRLRNEAEFIYEEEISQAPKLTFVDALGIAEDNNVLLAIKDAELESALRQKQRARSPLLPQVLTNAAYQKNRLTVDTPLFPEDLVVAGLRVDQMIYDDRAVTDFRSSGRLHEGSEFEREAERLNVLSDAGTTFLTFVLSNVLLRVSADNVRLTEENLELSRVRFDAGYSGRDEVLRWESTLATRRSDRLRREADVQTAQIALNQVLGVGQDSRWVPEELDVDVGQRNFWLGRLGPVFESEQRAVRVVDALVAFAVESSPELRALDLAAEAVDIQASQRKRSFILPRFVASFSYDYFIDRSPDPPAGSRNDNYTIEIAAIYPLFQGGNKYYDMKLQQSQAEAIRSQREFARQRVEQGVRTAARQAASSFVIIELSRSAADNARQNLDIVQDQYSQGIVNVTDLLSAQNDFFVADQNAEASVYTFLVDLVDVQRAIAWFEVDKTPEEQDAFYSRIREEVGE